MARNTDHRKVCEAIQLQKLWRYEGFGPTTHLDGGIQSTYITDYDERLCIQYGRMGRIKTAVYTHWDRDTGDIVSVETIRTGKRERVLHLINQGRNPDGLTR